MIIDIVFGFLGAGKTTFITKVLGQWGDREKTVVLVNEFGEVGIDGTVLQDKGGYVVEMPSGCICCTLQADFRSQLLDIIRTIQPRRVLIEPTGVATITQIRSILKAQIFENVIDTVHNVLVADATGFMGLYRANPHFVQSQVSNAHVVLLNKCDKVEPRRALLTRDAISAINPDATVLMTEFGALDWGQYQLALSAPPGLPLRDSELTSEAQPPEREGHEAGLVHLQEEREALGYESIGLIYEDLFFDQPALEDLFQQLSASHMGEVVRAKGIFRVGSRWLLLELSSGELSFQPLQSSDKSKVSIIGRGLNKKEIGAAFERCASVPRGIR